MTFPSPPPPARDPVPDPSGDPVPYPAPYEEPWGRLAGDLRAVAASTGLKVRELWRRNGEGDLSVPGFWPAAWAALFWPLLLALGLASLLALGLGLARGLGGLPSASPSASLSSPELSPPAPRALPRSSPRVVPEPKPELKAVWDRATVLDRQTAGGAASVPAPPPTLELDPLLGLLIQDDSGTLIASARPVPAEGRLDLELSNLFQALPDPRRQQQADAWLQRSRDLGYEHLRLLDAEGVVMGQAARVGGGMVLLDPPGPAGS